MHLERTGKIRNGYKVLVGNLFGDLEVDGRQVLE
jgi:hypothetical protein